MAPLWLISGDRCPAKSKLKTEDLFMYTSPKHEILAENIPSWRKPQSFRWLNLTTDGMQILDGGVTVLDFVCHSDHLPNCDSRVFFFFNAALHSVKNQAERFVSMHTLFCNYWIELLWNYVNILLQYLLPRHESEKQLPRQWLFHSNTIWKVT